MIVNAKDISAEHACIIDHSHHEAELPILTIVEALGGKVEWVSETEVNILNHGNRVITIDLDKPLYDLLIAPGDFTHSVRKTVDGEIIIDAVSAGTILHLFKASSSLDCENKTVTVTSRTDN